MRKIHLNKLFKSLSPEENFVFLETSRFDKDNRCSYLFKNPLNIISCYDSNEVSGSLNQIEKMTKKGFFAAGFISYEAGFAFEKILKQKKHSNFPLLWFGIFKKPLIFDHRHIEFEDYKLCGRYSIGSIKQDISEKEYIDSIKKIKKYIEKGHTYQVNRTFKLDFSFKGCPEDLYLNLRQKQSVPYSAIIKFGKKYILSFSPELFFRQKKGVIQVKPMKGTIERGRFMEEDIRNSVTLNNCSKNRSENIMIVDLLRNDLGRISHAGTVKTNRFFEVEKYESLFQMTSTIEGKARDNVSLYDLFKSTFPSGSVTGAPKIRTMQIIDEIEESARRIYTGSIGFIAPCMHKVFNVAIRTLLIDQRSGSGEMGIGSGVVYDSDPKKEYEECLLKAKFLTERSKHFSLIETMLWHPARGFELLEFHLQRLKESSEYFGYKYDKNKLIKYFNNIQKCLDKNNRCRLRLLLNKQGDIKADYSILHDIDAPKTITFSTLKTDSSNKWLYHKTTNRGLYDSEYQRHKEMGFFDVIFTNEKGQVTEGAISNIFVKKNGVYYTPPIECGVLNGVYRRYILTTGKLDIREKILFAEDLLNADSIFISNAVRGMVGVRFCKNPLLAQKTKINKTASTEKEYIHA